jgi:hypothetical protein
VTLARANPRTPNTGGWQDRHNLAMLEPSAGFEFALVHMLRGWHRYAQVHLQRFESPIGDDGVLGREWQAIGQALLGLLKGETGRLDCGTLDGFIRDTLTANGAAAE